MNRSTQILHLPVGDTPNWEATSSVQEGIELKGVAERYTSHLFSVFSTRSRGGKQPDVVPPPHTLYNRGRCTLEIGPHLFSDTTVFEVHYHPVHVPVAPPTTFVYQSAPSGSWQLSTQSKSSTPFVQSNDPPTPSPASISGQSTPLLASLPSTLHVTQTLVTQVNQAASSNPTLANLLQLAVAGKASPDQLKTLGLLIQSLASTQATGVDPPQPSANAALPKTQPEPSTATVPAPQYHLQSPIRDFDLVLEFKETPTDRWTFPRGPAKCEFIPMSGFSGAFGDVVLTAALPFAPTNTQQGTTGSEATSETQSVAKQAVTFRFKSASTAVWDTISRWVGPRAEEYSKILSEIKPPEKKFLAHKLFEGAELSQIQNAAVPSFSMRAIKPAAENKTKRKMSRKNLTEGNNPTSPATKRKRNTQNKSQAIPSQMACFSCGQTDVPLIKGGRYCRPCVNNGRACDPPTGVCSAPEDGQSTKESGQDIPATTPQPPTAAQTQSTTNNNGDAIDDPGT
ncbi:hypothetical protein J3A83DRAFT_4526242 [Scleroderma citrinum]